MAKEPQFPKRDLNQTAVDAIATRIDSYDQAWERRIAAQDEKWDARMHSLGEKVDRIADGVEEIRGFIGQAAELQVQTQHKIDRLSDKINAMVDAMRQQDQAWDRRLDRLTESIEGQQATTRELIKLVTVLAQKAV